MHLGHFDLVEEDVDGGKTLGERLERDLVLVVEAKYLVQIALIEHDGAVHEIGGKVEIGDGGVEAHRLALVRTLLRAFRVEERHLAHLNVRADVGARLGVEDARIAHVVAADLVDHLLLHAQDEAVRTRVGHVNAGHFA